MEATALSLGKAVLGGALSYAKSQAAEEVALQLGVEDDVVFITDELQMMQSFLMTADEERSQSKVLTTWPVTQVRDLAYNVEDSLMDYFGLHAGKKLRAKVEDVSNRNLHYRLIKDGSSSKPPAAAAAGATAAVEKDGCGAASDGAAMFGINQAMIAVVEHQQAKADLLQLVTSKEVDLRVVAVWGTAGDTGKTTAIHEVYDDPSVTPRYGLRAWVRIIHPFEPRVFLHSLVRQFLENVHDDGKLRGEGGKKKK